MNDMRPLADPEYEKFALSMFRLELSTEEFAARHGHEFAMFNFDAYCYATPGMTAGVDQLAAFLFAPDLQTRLRSARVRFLSAKEIEDVEAFERDPF